MKANAYWMAAVVALMLSTLPGTAVSAAEGNVIVKVQTTPEIGNRTLRFAGEPEGSLTLGNDGSGSLSMAVAVGAHASTLAQIDQRLLDAGYRLVNIQCDDVASATRSDGELQQKRANFAVDAAETVTCTFQLSIDLGCGCPKEGRWQVRNHLGSMTCTGSMNMSMPMMASSSRGTLKPGMDCQSVLADGMSDDEHDITMHVQPDCSWKGSVQATEDGMPVTIHFRWALESETRITGDLYSNINTQGATCRMARTFELDFSN